MFHCTPDVLGLEATASWDYAVRDVFVAVYRDLLQQKLGQMTRMESGRLGALIGNTAQSHARPVRRPLATPGMTPVRRAVLLLRGRGLPRVSLTSLASRTSSALICAWVKE